MEEKYAQGISLVRHQPQKDDALIFFKPDEHLKISLTTRAVSQILSNIQDILFDCMINLKDLTKKMCSIGIPSDVLESVIKMTAKPEETAKLVSQCTDIETLSLFIYAVIRTIGAFFIRKNATYSEYIRLIIQRFFSIDEYKSDEAFFSKLEMNQSNFAKIKKKALIAFTRRLNAEFIMIIKTKFDDQGTSEFKKRNLEIYKLLFENDKNEEMNKMFSGTIFSDARNHTQK